MYRASNKITGCIVDEATQSNEQETLIPLMLGVTKLIMVGDPQQLPATTMSMVRNQLKPRSSHFTYHLLSRTQKITDTAKACFPELKKALVCPPTTPFGC